ncbi:MAG: ATP-binding cassette domain-containing protein, partial [Anaerolineae bacterium]|nr:ATP-binding cassette domain-containing protein [Anaerolineae bacterium]
MAAGAILRAEALSYAYPQHGLGLAPLDFEAQRGELWTVTGESGCGKSTLARCLTGLIPHLYRGQMGGSVWIEGSESRQTPLWRLCESAGLLFQNPLAQSVGTTAQDEISFGLEHLDLAPADRRARCETYLGRFGLGPLRQRRPDTLSGGELQRLMLAAVLAREPAALVLDEPLSMLDTVAASDLVAQLDDLAREGRTVVACEHRHDYFDALPHARRLHLPSAKPHPDIADMPSIPLPVRGEPGDIVVEGLTLRFGQRTLMRDLSLRLHGGQVAALIGRNGVGKTTLLRALAGLQRHGGAIHATDGGTVELGLMFQNPDWQLFNPSVRAEIRYRLAEPVEALYAWLLDALSLRSYEEVPPLLLSEGEKKRVALAILLMRMPRHGILLDEPTLGQDDRHRTLMTRTARSLAEAGRMVLAATHDLDWAVHAADRFILLAPEGLIADGPPGEVLRDAEAWRRAGLIVPPWLQRR